MKILICDDEYAARLITRSYLASYGLDAEEASSGEEALAIIKEKSPDLLIIDYSMPGMTGLDVLKETAGISAIILTSEGFNEKTENELKNYAACYLVKPVSEEQLIEAVEKVTGKDIIHGKR